MHLKYTTLTNGLFRNVIGTAYKSAFFGKGTGRVAMSRVDCSGSEISLFSCPADMTGGVNCDHSRDAGVSCSGKVDYVTIVCLKLNGHFLMRCVDDVAIHEVISLRL